MRTPSAPSALFTTPEVRRLLLALVAALPTADRRPSALRYRYANGAFEIEGTDGRHLTEIRLPTNGTQRWTEESLTAGVPWRAVDIADVERVARKLSATSGKPLCLWAALDCAGDARVPYPPAEAARAETLRGAQPANVGGVDAVVLGSLGVLAAAVSRHSHGYLVLTWQATKAGSHLLFNLPEHVQHATMTGLLLGMRTARAWKGRRS